MADVVKFGADAREYFSVVDQMRGKLNELAGAHEKAGSIGFANEYRVDRQAKFLVGSLLQAKSGAEGAGAAMVAFALAANLPLGIAIAGVAAGEAILKMGADAEKTKKAYNELQIELNKPLDVQAHLSGEAIGADLEKLQQKMAETEKQYNSTTSKILRFFSTPVGTFDPLAGRGPEILAAGHAKDLALSNLQIAAELKVLAIKREAFQVSKGVAAMLKANVDFENAAARVIEEAASRADRFDFDRLAILFKRISALRQERDLMVQIAQSSAAAASFQQYQKAAGAYNQFAQSVGNGQFVAGLAQQDAQENARAFGEALIAELRSDLAKGITLGPNAQRILEEADRQSQLPANQDFSGLASLDGLQFTGLRALDGLNITVK
jgi:hypothetical protein